MHHVENRDLAHAQMFCMCVAEDNVFLFLAPSRTVSLLIGVFHKDRVLVPYYISSTLQNYSKSLNDIFQILTSMRMIHNYISLLQA